MPSLPTLSLSDDVDESFFDQLGDDLDKQVAGSELSQALEGLCLSTAPTSHGNAGIEQLQNHDAGASIAPQIVDEGQARLGKIGSFSDFLSNSSVQEQQVEVPQGDQSQGEVELSQNCAVGDGLADANQDQTDQTLASWSHYDYRAWEQQYPGWTYNPQTGSWEPKQGYVQELPNGNGYEAQQQGGVQHQIDAYGVQQQGFSAAADAGVQQQGYSMPADVGVQQQSYSAASNVGVQQQGYVGVQQQGYVGVQQQAYSGAADVGVQQQANGYDAAAQSAYMGSAFFQPQMNAYGTQQQQQQQAYAAVVQQQFSGAAVANGSGMVHNMGAGSFQSPNYHQQPVTSSSAQGAGSFGTSSWTSANGTTPYAQATPWHASQSVYAGEQYPNFNQAANDYGYQDQHYQFGQRVDYTVSPPQTREEALRSTAGRPPHTVVAFGFGGRLVAIKPKDPFSSLEQTAMCQVFQLNQLAGEGSKGFGFGRFTGPLAGGASMKEVLKWIDEKASSCSEEPGCADITSLKHLWGLLKIVCQHYGNLRSPVTAAGIGKQDDSGPEAALAKLLEPPRSTGAWAYSRCLQPMPSEQELQATAFEVKALLVAGKQKEALQCAQAGQLWATALVLARQLGEKHYCDTLAEMARRHFQPGFPLRTLSLLFAGQQAGVFAGSAPEGIASQGALPAASQDVVEGMLEEWQENLAIMAANRTAGDEQVIMYLGDCLWKLRNQVAAAHICYLVANANFDPFSSNARLCLIGADHGKHPRTYALPEAIQRTEVYEFARVSGNAQFVLLPFQPYKLIYASMLAEAGKINEALRYCQAVSKALRTAGHGADVCKEAAVALEERLRMHSEAGSSSIVQRMFSSMGFRKIVGGASSVSGPRENADADVRPASAYGRTSASPLVPSASMEPLSGPRSSMPVRSISEPDFHRPERIDSPRAQGHARSALSSFVQRAIGLIRTPTREAKLGDKSTFRYDKTLGRWVEDGVEPVEEVPLPPPPISRRPVEDQAALGTGTPTPVMAADSPMATAAPPPIVGSGTPMPVTATTPERPQSASGIPPMPPSSNQYSARSRTVRSRYVDTFNKNQTSPSKSFDTSSLLAPARHTSMPPPTKFFVPVAAPESPTLQQETPNSALVPEQPVYGPLDGPPLGTQSPLPPDDAVPGMLKSSTEGKGVQQPNGTQGMFYLPASTMTTLLPPAAAAAAALPPRIEAAAAAVPGSAPAQSQEGEASAGEFGDEMQEVEL